MKKLSFIFLALILVLGCSVVAFADFTPMPSDPDAYSPDFVPFIPDFLSGCDGSLFMTSLDIDVHWASSSAEQTF